MSKTFDGYRIIDKLKDREAYTKYDIAHELNLHHKTAQIHLRELWTLELIYICGWDREGTVPIPAYRWGNKPDVERPEPRTDAEKSKQYRLRVSQQKAAQEVSESTRRVA
jgi:hypothetical protein